MQNLCENFSAIGYEHPGGFAEYMLVPASMLKDGSVNKIPDNISFDEEQVPLDLNEEPIIISNVICIMLNSLL